MADQPNRKKEDSNSGEKPAAEQHEIALAIDSLKQVYHSHQRQSAEHDRQTLRWTKGATVGVAIYTLLTLPIAIASICAAHYSRKQASASLEGNAVNREAFTSVQRAFIGVSSFDIYQRTRPDPGTNKEIKYWWFVPIIKNSGNTPTKNMFYLPIATVFSNPIAMAAGQMFSLGGGAEPKDPQDFWDGKLPDGHTMNVPKKRTVIAPQTSSPIGGIGITEGALDSVRRGGPFYFYGMIQYNDIFPESKLHVTKFCYAIRVEGSPQGEPAPAYGFCGHWNCADDECKDDRNEWEKEFTIELLFPCGDGRGFVIPEYCLYALAIAAPVWAVFYPKSTPAGPLARGLKLVIAVAVLGLIGWFFFNFFALVFVQCKSVLAALSLAALVGIILFGLTRY